MFISICFLHQVVKLKDVFPHGTGFVLVFEYMLSDLSEVIRNSQRPLTESQVKGYMMMLLKGVAFCHENSIMHRVGRFCCEYEADYFGWCLVLLKQGMHVLGRKQSYLSNIFILSKDLKPANLLISSTGHLKIADFGLARLFSNEGERLYSHQVATRWETGLFNSTVLAFYSWIELFDNLGLSIKVDGHSNKSHQTNKQTICFHSFVFSNKEDSDWCYINSTGLPTLTLDCCWASSVYKSRIESEKFFPTVFRWYRAPELLYGARKYDEGVDLWYASQLRNLDFLEGSLPLLSVKY